MSVFTRSRTPRRRSENKAPGRLALSAAGVTLVVLAFIAFGVHSVNGVPGQDYHKLYASLPDIGNLRPHDEVRVAGVRVGQVLGQEIHNGRSRLEIQLLPDTGRMPVDTTVVIRARGLLGSRYLELKPGRSSRLLGEGDTITGPPVTTVTNGVADFLDAFDRETRGGLGDMLDGLGLGLTGNGEPLNNAIHASPGLTSDLVRVADSIEAKDGAARAFLPSLNEGLGAFDASREQIADSFGAGADGLQPFRDARSGVQETLDVAPSTLSAMQTGLGTGRRLLTSARSLARALRTTLPAAPAGLRSTAAMLRTSATPLRRTGTLLDALGPTVPSVLQITKALSPNLVPLRRAFSDLLPVVGQLGLRACDVQNFADNWRSVLGYGAPSRRDLPGGDAGYFNQLRVNVVAGPQSLSSVAPMISKPFVHNRDVYEPPCTHSPGPHYSTFGVGTPKGAAK